MNTDSIPTTVIAPTRHGRCRECGHLGGVFQSTNDAHLGEFCIEGHYGEGEDGDLGCKGNYCPAGPLDLPITETERKVAKAYKIYTRVTVLVGEHKFRTGQVIVIGGHHAAMDKYAEIGPGELRVSLETTNALDKSLVISIRAADVGGSFPL